MSLHEDIALLLTRTSPTALAEVVTKFLHHLDKRPHRWREVAVDATLVLHISNVYDKLLDIEESYRHSNGLGRRSGHLVDTEFFDAVRNFAKEYDVGAGRPGARVAKGEGIMHFVKLMELVTRMYKVLWALEEAEV